MIQFTMTEDDRRKVALFVAHGGWWGAFGLLITNVALGGSRPAGSAPPWLGLIIVFLIGVGIAGGTALARMRMARTIMSAMDQGYRMFKLREDTQDEEPSETSEDETESSDTPYMNLYKESK